MDGKQVRAGQGASAAAYLPTAVALCIILFAGLFADRQNRAMADLDERAAVHARVEAIAGALAGRIGVGASAADRLAGALAVQPAVEPSTLAALAGQLPPGSRVAVVPRIGDPLLIGGDDARARRRRSPACRRAAAPASSRRRRARGWRSGAGRRCRAGAGRR